jgi:S1-C subfamily serine protease
MKWKQNAISFILGMAIMLPTAGYAANKITAQYNDVKVTVDGEQVKTKVVGVVEQGQQDGRNFTSAADVAKAMGGTVAWNGVTKTVEIKTPRTDLETVVANVKDSAVMIYVYKGDQLTATGSGFYYNGYVITARHVTDYGDKYLIFTDDNKYSVYAESLVKLDTKLDVSALKLKLDIPAVKLGDSSKLIEGQKLVAITSPGGTQNSVDECIYSGLQFYDNKYSINLSEVEMNGGSSGGAIFNKQSELVAMNTNGDVFTNSAIPINDLKPLLSKLK